MSARGTADEVSLGQLTTIISRVTLALPEALSSSELDIKSIIKYTGEGERLSLAIAEAFKMLYGGHVATVPPRFLEVRMNRSVPMRYLVNWQIVDKDTRSLELRTIIPAKIKFKTMLEDGEISISSHEVRRRAKEKNLILLDLDVLNELRASPSSIPKEMKGRSSYGLFRIFFDGVTVRHSRDEEDQSFFMRFHPSGNIWEEETFSLSHLRGAGDYTAVLEPEDFA